jgi:hypothetical protein
MKFQSIVKMLFALKKKEGWTMLESNYVTSMFDPYIWVQMRDLFTMLTKCQWDAAQKQMYSIWELGYSFEDILFELEHSVVLMNIIDHRAWYNIQQFLIQSWIFHSQSRSSILDLMSACGEVKPWSVKL